MACDVTTMRNAPHLLSDADISLHINDLHEFECALYGPDFACSLEELRPWLASRYFYYTVFGDTLSDGVDVSASASAIVITRSDYEQLLDGTRRESELTPWTPDCGDEPVVYFASFFARTADAGRLVIDTLRADLARAIRGLGAKCVVALGATASGAAYLERRGFNRTRAKYLGKYPVFETSVDAFLRGGKARQLSAARTLHVI